MFFQELSYDMDTSTLIDGLPQDSSVNDVIISDFVFDLTYDIIRFIPDAPFDYFKNGRLYKTKPKTLMVLFNKTEDGVQYKYIPYLQYFNTVKMYSITKKFPAYKLTLDQILILKKFHDRVDNVSNFCIVVCPVTGKMFPVNTLDYFKALENKKMLLSNEKLRDIGLYPTSKEFEDCFVKDQLLLSISDGSKPSILTDTVLEDKTLIVQELLNDDGSGKLPAIDFITKVHNDLAPYIVKLDYRIIDDNKNMPFPVLSTKEIEFIEDLAIVFTKSKTIGFSNNVTLAMNNYLNVNSF